MLWVITSNHTLYLELSTYNWSLKGDQNQNVWGETGLIIMTKGEIGDLILDNLVIMSE